MYGFNNRLLQVEEGNSQLNDRAEENFQMATWSSKAMKNSKERLISVEDRKFRFTLSYSFRMRRRKMGRSNI